MSVRPFAAATLALILSTCLAHADPLSDLQGAWAIQGSECNDVFSRVGDKTELRKRDDDTLPGFIVDGKSVRGIAGTCDVLSAKGQTTKVTLLLSCKSQIMSSTMTVHLQITNPMSIVQVDPDFPEVTTNFHKCTM